MSDLDQMTGRSDAMGGGLWVGYSRMIHQFQPGLAAASRSWFMSPREA
jgi:hypothetical protein